MKLTKRILSAALLCQLVLAVAGAVLLYFGMTLTFQPDYRHFTTVWPYVGCLAIVIGAGLMLSIVTAVLFRRSELARTPAPDTLPSGLVLALVFAMALAGLLLLLSCVFDWRDAKAVAESTPTSTSAAFVFLLRTRAVLAIPAAAFCLWQVLGAFVRLPATPKKVLGMLFMLWSVMSALSVYFSSREAINSPVKALLLLLSVTVMLFTTAECRIQFERRGAARLLFFTIPLIVAGGAVSLASLVLAVTDSALLGVSLVNGALYTALWLMAVLRFASFAAVAEKPTEETV